MTFTLPEPTWKENDFLTAYKMMATKQGLSLNPDDPEHFYDYRALFKETGSLTPDATGHFPSKFKKEGHPNIIVDDINTKTGEFVLPKPGEGFILPEPGKEIPMTEMTLPQPGTKKRLGGDIQGFVAPGVEAPPEDPYPSQVENIAARTYSNIVEKNLVNAANMVNSFIGREPYFHAPVTEKVRQK